MPTVGTDFRAIRSDHARFGAVVHAIGIVRENKHAIRATFPRLVFDKCASLRPTGTSCRSICAMRALHDAVVRERHAKLPTNLADVLDNDAIVSLNHALLTNKCA